MPSCRDVSRCVNRRKRRCGTRIHAAKTKSVSSSHRRNLQLVVHNDETGCYQALHRVLTEPYRARSRPIIAELCSLFPVPECPVQHRFWGPGMWALQPQLSNGAGRQPNLPFSHVRFRDVLCPRGHGAARPGTYAAHLPNRLANRHVYRPDCIYYMRPQGRY